MEDHRYITPTEETQLNLIHTRAESLGLTRLNSDDLLYTHAPSSIVYRAYIDDYTGYVKFIIMRPCPI